MIYIASGAYRLVLDPNVGGSILAFEWYGASIMRPACGPGILEVACFPLVPFANRIGNGLVRFQGETTRLIPNMPAIDPIHPLHGFGWLSPWNIRAVADDAVVIEHA